MRCILLTMLLSGCAFAQGPSALGKAITSSGRLTGMQLFEVPINAIERKALAYTLEEVYFSRGLGLFIEEPFLPATAQDEFLGLVREMEADQDLVLKWAYVRRKVHSVWRIRDYKQLLVSQTLHLMMGGGRFTFRELVGWLEPHGYQGFVSGVEIGHRLTMEFSIRFVDLSALITFRQMLEEKPWVLDAFLLQPHEGVPFPIDDQMKLEFKVVAHCKGELVHPPMIPDAGYRGTGFMLALRYFADLERWTRKTFDDATKADTTKYVGYILTTPQTFYERVRGKPLEG